MAEPWVNRNQQMSQDFLNIYRVPGISAVPHEDNLRYFDVSIHGPSQSPYEGMLVPSSVVQEEH